MKFLRIIIMLVLTVGSLSSAAQKRYVVVDLETLAPIAGTNIVGKGPVLTTDSTGYFEVGDSINSVLFSHVNYESRLVNLSEIGDTVFLISKYLALKEVVVLGKGKNEDKLQQLRERLRLDKTEAALLGIDPSSGANLLGLVGKLIPKKWRKSSKKEKKKRLKEILEEY